MNDRYKKYSIEDLILDDVFIEWVHHPNEAMDQKWHQWILDNPEMESRIAEARQMVKNIAFKKINTRRAEERIWQRIEQDIKTTPKVINGKGRLYRILAATAAAASLLFFLVTQLTHQESILIKATPGMVSNHQLPDQSLIRINDGSQISYDLKEYEKTREIQLAGEAFFEVRKGKPFTVFTTNGRIDVLGTSFNVFSHDQHFSVACKTGKVRVSNQLHEVVLHPGESATADTAGNLIIMKNEDIDIKWLDGIYEYQDTKLEVIVSELERQFDIHIQLPEDLKNTRYTGFFIDDNLEQALQSVFWPLKLKIDQQGNQIIIDRED